MNFFAKNLTSFSIKNNEFIYCGNNLFAKKKKILKKIKGLRVFKKKEKKKKKLKL